MTTTPGAALCRAFGIDPDQVTKITITINAPHCGSTMVVERFLTAAEAGEGSRHLADHYALTAIEPPELTIVPADDDEQERIENAVDELSNPNGPGRHPELHALPYEESGC